MILQTINLPLETLSNCIDEISSVKLQFRPPILLSHRWRSKKSWWKSLLIPLDYSTCYNINKEHILSDNQDDHAGEHDSKSTIGSATVLVGLNTYFPWGTGCGHKSQCPFWRVSNALFEHAWTFSSSQAKAASLRSLKPTPCSFQGRGSSEPFAGRDFCRGARSKRVRLLKWEKCDPQLIYSTSKKLSVRILIPKFLPKNWTEAYASDQTRSVSLVFFMILPVYTLLFI